MARTWENYLVVTDADISANYTSPEMKLSRATDRASIQLVSASAARGGSITVEVSNNKTDWVAVDFDDGTSSVTVTGSSALSAFVNISDLCAEWLRVVFTDSASGAGTLKIYAIAR